MAYGIWWRVKIWWFIFSLLFWWYAFTLWMRFLPLLCSLLPPPWSVRREPRVPLSPLFLFHSWRCRRLIAFFHGALFYFMRVRKWVEWWHKIHSYTSGTSWHWEWDLGCCGAAGVDIDNLLKLEGTWSYLRNVSFVTLSLTSQYDWCLGPWPNESHLTTQCRYIYTAYTHNSKVSIQFHPASTAVSYI
jgi:hypothetical protein